MLRPEQKSVERMEILIFKLCKAGELILDICTNTLATVKAC